MVEGAAITILTMAMATIMVTTGAVGVAEEEGEEGDCCQTLTYNWTTTEGGRLQ